MNRFKWTAALSLLAFSPIPQGIARSAVVFTCNTIKHHIQIELPDTMGNQYTYRAWNLPRRTSQKADFEITNGFVDNNAGFANCPAVLFSFYRSGTEIDVVPRSACVGVSFPKNVTAQINVFTNTDDPKHGGNPDATYWCR